MWARPNAKEILVLGLARDRVFLGNKEVKKQTEAGEVLGREVRLQERGKQALC